MVSRVTGSWDDQEVALPEVGGVGWASVGAEEDGSVHMIWYTTGGLWHVTDAGGAFAAEALEAEASTWGFGAMAVDALGAVHFTHQAGTLSYTTNRDESCED
jgi:hypothetical protein